MDSWYWSRFAGLGPWKDHNTYWGCPHCRLRFDGSPIPEVKLKPTTESFKTIDKKRAHFKDVQTRVLADDGQTVLKGREGLAYMEKHAAGNPGYVKRLKDYHNA